MRCDRPQSSGCWLRNSFSYFPFPCWTPGIASHHTAPSQLVLFLYVRRDFTLKCNRDLFPQLKWRSCACVSVSFTTLSSAGSCYRHSSFSFYCFVESSWESLVDIGRRRRRSYTRDHPGPDFCLVPFFIFLLRGHFLSWPTRRLCAVSPILSAQSDTKWFSHH
jgi:hypothetical protein